MFFTDLTTLYNELNKTLLGHGHIVLTMFENIKGFEKKLKFIVKILKMKNLNNFHI